MLRNKSIAFKLGFFVLTSNILIFGALFFYDYYFARRIIVGQIKDNVDRIYANTRNQVESVLRPVERSAESLARVLESKSYDRATLLDLTRSVVENNREIYGASASFEPYAFRKDSLYFAPYFYRRQGRVEFTMLGGENYRYFEWDWYQIPRTIKQPVWSEPYFDEHGGGIVMSTYSVPFFRREGGETRFVGVATADVSLDWLQQIVSNIKISRNGYAFLISRTGKIITHPRKELIMNESIFSLAEAGGDRQLREVGRSMTAGLSGSALITSPVTGEKEMLFYTPLSISGWSLGVVIPDKEIMAGMSSFNRAVIITALAGSCLMVMVIMIIAGGFSRPLRILSGATEKIAAGNLDFEIPPYPDRDEIGRLTASFIGMKDSLKRYIRELTETTAAKERIESELSIAHNIQMSMLPEAVSCPAACDIHGVLEPAREVGGDLYYFFPLDDRRLCLMIGDVSGKGVPAALFMAMTVTLLRAMAVQELPVDRIIAGVNRQLAHRNDSNFFTTLFFAVLDVRTGEVRYVNAGHNPPLVLKGGTVEFLTGRPDAPLGVDEGSAFHEQRLELGADGGLLLYTDGVTEAENAGGRMYTAGRLKDLLSTDAGLDARGLVDLVLRGVGEFTGDIPRSDDLTLLCIRLKSNPNVSSDLAPKL